MCQPHKMDKLIKTISRLLPTNCLRVFDHFIGLTLKGLTYDKLIHSRTIFLIQNFLTSFSPVLRFIWKPVTCFARMVSI